MTAINRNETVHSRERPILFRVVFGKVGFENRRCEHNRKCVEWSFHGNCFCVRNSLQHVRLTNIQVPQQRPAYLISIQELNLVLKSTYWSFRSSFVTSSPFASRVMTGSTGTSGGVGQPDEFDRMLRNYSSSIDSLATVVLPEDFQQGSL